MYFLSYEILDYMSKSVILTKDYTSVEQISDCMSASNVYLKQTRDIPSQPSGMIQSDSI